MSEPKVRKDVSQRNDDLDLGEEIQVNFLKQENGEEMWLTDVKPRKKTRLTKADLQREVEKLRDRLKNKSENRVWRYTHVIAEAAAVIVLGTYMNPVNVLIGGILLVHIAITIISLVKEQAEENYPEE